MKRLSRYAYFFRSGKYGSLLYNSRTNTFAKISDNLYDALSHLKEHPEEVDSLLDSEYGEQLKRTKTLCDENEDDEFVLIQKLQHHLASFNQTQLGLTVAPTMDCNFRCPYCYEENKTVSYMDEGTEDSIVRFIEAHKPAKTVFVSWYGGEPLLNFQSMERLLLKMKAVADKDIVQQSLITNGFLLDESKFPFFEKNPIRQIQVTIDGSRERHDATRLHKDPRIKTYDRIVENVARFAQRFPKTRVNLRVHVSQDTSSDFSEACRELNKVFAQYPNVVPYPGFIVDYTNCCEKMNNRQISDFFYRLHKENVYHAPFYPSLAMGGCCATTLNAYVVDAKGLLYKCWVDIDKPERAIGNLADMKIGNSALLASYLVGYSMYDDPRCQKCFFLPICDGGCAYRRRVNSEGKNMELCTTMKNDLDRNLETHYEMKLKKETL